MSIEQILVRILDLIKDDPELHRAVVSLIEALAADKLILAADRLILAADRLISSYLKQPSYVKQQKLEKTWAAEIEEKRP